MVMNGLGGVGGGVGVVVAVAAGLLLSGCGYSMPPGGCSGADARLAATLDTLPILNATAPGATRDDSASWHGCGDSVDYAAAHRLYQTTTSPWDVAEFYQRTAVADGWKLERSRGTSPQNPANHGEALCLSRTVADGTRAVLSVMFLTRPDEGPDELFGSAPRDVHLAASADAEGTLDYC